MKRTRPRPARRAFVPWSHPWTVAGYPRLTPTAYLRSWCRSLREFMEGWLKVVPDAPQEIATRTRRFQLDQGSITGSHAVYIEEEP